VSILKRYIIAFGFLALAAADIVVYVTAFRGHTHSSLFFVSLVVNVLFLAAAFTRGKEPIPPKLTREQKRKTSRRMRIIGGVLVAFCAANIMFTARGGTPLKDKDGYYIKTLSGKHLEISQQKYEDLSNLQTMLFSGMWMAINLAFASSILLRD
jgi:amino acid transporter